MSNHYRYGINVKVRNLPTVEGENELSDEVRQAIWDSVCEEFWQTMNDSASDFGVNKFYSEGRMGGWLVPDPVIEPDTLEFETLKREVNNQVGYFSHIEYPERIQQALDELETRREACIIRSNN